MLTRIYAHNFRSLVGFEAKFEPFGVLCGPNGSGKSSVFDALQLIRDLGMGAATLGGDRPSDLPRLEFTQWISATTQDFELGLRIGGRNFEYAIQLEQKADFEKPRVLSEKASCDGRVLFERNLEGVRFLRTDGTSTGFPLDWRQAALPAFQPKGSIAALKDLQDALARLLILRPDPRAMERESRAEVQYPDRYLTGLISWYRTLSQDLEWSVALRDSLRMIWPDFRSFRLIDVGVNTKALQLRFAGESGATCDLGFEQLSDGERALVALYMVREALASGAVSSVLIDEPDNFVGLPELQPWVLALRELLDDQHQALLITHHPEVLGTAGVESGHYFWRDGHTSPTRFGPLRIPEGLSPGEAIARGWVHA
ncbi:MAG: AAA family ATPase [Xanthomonadales bacterium]|jgi:energy-coupling factor transporter ATP-binding protein EcfA2|nr:AAA family ATPase [Xanthomonadales bacterium]